MVKKPLPTTVKVSITLDFGFFMRVSGMGQGKPSFLIRNIFVQNFLVFGGENDLFWRALEHLRV